MRMTVWSAPKMLVLGAAFLVACYDMPSPTEPIPEAFAPAFGLSDLAWSEPLLLDGAVNSPFREFGPMLSPDNLSLYFHSNRPAEGMALFDIYVSRRACLECPFEQAELLPPPINGLDNAGQSTFSRDGHFLFFLSNRTGSVPLADGSGPSEDVWMTWRKDRHDDLAWENPVQLTSPRWCTGDGRVNTEEHELVSAYVVSVTGLFAHLYFGRSNRTAPFRVLISRFGKVLGCAERVTELDGFSAPSVRGDGREAIVVAQTSGTGVGLLDLWVSTRPTPWAPWSTPVNLGTPVNSPFADLEASISHDGMTLMWSSAQARGGLGLQDIWMSTRSHP